MNAHNPSAYKSDGHKSPEKLESEVDQVRARLGRTVDELSYRLSPGELLDQALHMAREHGGEFGRNLATQAKHNPIPLLLTGVGLSWLMFSSNEFHYRYYAGTLPDDEDYTTYDLDGYPDENDESGVKKTLGDTVERTRQASHAVKQKVQDVSHNVRDVSSNVREKVRSGGESATHLFEEHPLIAGSLGVAVGAALGALIPPTRTEDNLLGRMSDEATEKATSAAHKQYEKVRDAAGDIGKQTRTALAPE